MYTFEQLKKDREVWRSLEFIPIQCSHCKNEFETRYGTLYNVIRREAEGIYCSRTCAGSARALSTQNKYREAGGKICKRCGEFRALDCFSSLPSPPYFRAECKRCHNYKPARQYSISKDKANRSKIKFTLTLDQFLEFWNKNCYYCNSEIKSIRLEMMNLDDGYVLSNVVSCCRQCQKFKNDLNHDEFVSLCQKISNNIKL